ncbi:hypothetical protein [Schaalia odontolytica]|uniref:hypothetical protein n=1 Tax=Schaalia odontolytica TaxID=1660 RepID=UPI001D079D14|nr:hypothetical protein [Schaalia odontolytica]MCB6402076.1 hypothetical protein [Schaalia odontolytica]
MTKQKATRQEQLLICAIMTAFLSLNIVLGSFFSPGSWSPTVVTAAASYLIVFIVVAAAAGIRFLYRDWKTPPRHAAGSPSPEAPAHLATPPATPALHPTATAMPQNHPQPPSDFASIDGAITYAQQSGFTIINLFNEYAPLSKYGDAVGAEILYLAFSHIAEIDKNASLTVTGSATEEALTLTISALTDRAPVLGARRMGEIRALATTMGGSVDTDAQAASWTLTARLPTAAGAPS